MISRLVFFKIPVLWYPPKRKGARRGLGTRKETDKLMTRSDSDKQSCSPEKETDSTGMKS